MKKLTGIGMVIGEVDSNGTLVTKEAAKEMVDKFKVCPLGYEFNPTIPPVGKIIKAEIVGNNVEIEAELEGIFNEKFAIVPSFIIKNMHIEDGYKVIDSAELISFSLTSQPADDDVTIFEV